MTEFHFLLHSLKCERLRKAGKQDTCNAGLHESGHGKNKIATCLNLPNKAGQIPRYIFLPHTVGKTEERSQKKIRKAALSAADWHFKITKIPYTQFNLGLCTTLPGVSITVKDTGNYYSILTVNHNCTCSGVMHFSQQDFKNRGNPSLYSSLPATHSLHYVHPAFCIPPWWHFSIYTI